VQACPTTNMAVRFTTLLPIETETARKMSFPF